MTDEKKKHILHAIARSPLLKCLTDRNVREFRRNALLLVGIEADPTLDDDTASGEESSIVSLEESVEDPEESDTKSISCVSEIEESGADAIKPSLPADVPIPLHPRVRADMFSAANRTISSSVDLTSNLLGAATAKDAPVQDIFLP